MSYEIVRLIDAELERLQAARTILAELTSISEPASTLKPVSTRTVRSSQVLFKKRRTVPQADGEEQTRVATIVPQPTPGPRKKTVRRPRTLSAPKVISAPPRALGGPIPNGPVVIRPSVANTPQTPVPRSIAPRTLDTEEGTLESLMRMVAARTGREMLSMA